MIAFPSLLIGPASEAGIKVPPDLDQFDPAEYPHWSAYLNIQLGAPMPSPTSAWSNAKVVAAVPDDRIMAVTYRDLIDAGLEIGHSVP